MNRVVTILKSTILCIRFPFLYPRNRFTGTHYDYWPIIEFHRKWWKHTEDCFMLKITTEKKLLVGYGKQDDHIYTMRIKNDNLEICDEHYKPWLKIPISNYGKGEVIRVGWDKGKEPCMVVSEDFEENPNANHFIEVVHAKWLQQWIKFLDWINDYPLQLFHCLPNHTELDAMDAGWRKAFGIQICKEIRAALLSHGWKYLFAYRITQIKEKFGGLRWYDYNGTHEIQEIISKYEDISERTCIDCGKPATKISKGWICPYCDDCIGDREYTEIKDENNSSE